LLDGEVGGLGTREYLVYLVGRTPEHGKLVRSVRHEATRIDPSTMAVHCGHAVPCDELQDLYSRWSCSDDIGGADDGVMSAIMAAANTTAFVRDA
jgi:hypothetical protein